MKKLKIINLALALTLLVALVGAPTTAFAQAATSPLSNESNVYSPYIIAQVQNNAVYGEEWPIGIAVTLTIDNPANGTGVDYTAVAYPGEPYEWNPSVSLAEFNLGGSFTLAPGMIVTLSNGTVTKIHTVARLSVTSTNATTDKVFGTASPNDEVWVSCGDDRISRYVTTNASGNWQADFSVPGPTPEEQDLCNLQPGIWGFTINGGGDQRNDFTKYDWEIANTVTCYTLNFDISEGGYVQANPAPNCAGGRYTSGTPVTLKAIPGHAYEFAQWNGIDDFDELMISGTVIMDQNLEVQVSFQKKVIVLIHGWHGIPIVHHTDICQNPSFHYDTANMAIPNELNDFGVFPENLRYEGYDVWFACITTGPLGTPAFNINAIVLKGQINYIIATTHVKQVTLIAHSMGGLVAREYIESYGYSGDVERLITLGTPHTGTSFGNSLCNLLDIAACQFSPAGMLIFNTIHRKPSSIPYNLISGNLTPGLGGLDFLRSDGPNDGAVGSNSSIGKFPTGQVVVNGNVTRYIIPASHAGIEWKPINVSILDWFPSYFNASNGNMNSTTDAYNCVAQLLGIPGGSCPQPVTSTNPHAVLAQNLPQTRARLMDLKTSQLMALQDQFDPVKMMRQMILSLPGMHNYIRPPEQAVNSALPDAPLFTVSQTIRHSEHITTGQVVTHTVSIDTDGQTQFNLTWTNGEASLTLLDPNNTVIDPAYAAAHPGEVTYSDHTIDSSSQPYATYTLNAAVPGEYTITISADDVGAGGADYEFYSLVDSPRTLEATTNKQLYNVGEAATLTATIQNAGNGLSGADVQANVYGNGVFLESVSLTDEGNGLYTSIYNIPNEPGYLNLTFSAQGSDEGIAYEREVNALVAVSPSTAELTGSYSDSPVDADNNQKYELLNIDAGVNVTQAGDYIISGDLASGSTMIAHSVITTTLTAGASTVTLPFNGDDIRHGGVNGPYTLTNVTVADNQNGSVPAIWQVADAWTTAEYNSSDFAATCHVLNIVSPPWNGDVAAYPPPDCGTDQYATDTIVELTADPISGYLFKNWDGDVQGSTNPISVTMDANKTVLAVYEQPPFASAGADQTVFHGDTILLDASDSSDPDDNIASYEWDLDDDGQYDDASGVTATTVINDSGTFEIGLKVSDAFGLSTTDSLEVTVLGPQLTALDPAKIWVGLKNSDSVGIKFDLMAEVYQDNTLVGSGQLDKVSGGSSGFNNARLNTIPLTLFAPVDWPAGSTLSIKLYIRNTCFGNTHNSGTARLWYNDSAANSQFNATIDESSKDYFLKNGFVLGITPGSGPRKTIDVAAGSPCSAFKLFGTWSIIP